MSSIPQLTITYNQSMKSVISALAINLLFCAADALTLEKRFNPAILAIPFERKVGRPAFRFRNRGTIETPLNNEQMIYTVTLMLGTLPQAIRVQFDAGSSRN
jgi:hypothetical protein